MRISKKKILWTLLLLPYLKPDIVLGTMLSMIWSYTQFISLILGIIIIMKNSKNGVINLTTISISLFYGFQVIADIKNGIPFRPDFIIFIKMTILVFAVNILLNKNCFEFLIFVFRLFCGIIIINGITVFLTLGNGVTQDLYGAPIFFWATKNHLISIVIATLTFGYILSEMNLISLKHYKMIYCYTFLEVFFLQSSTALISLVIFTLFVYANNLYKRYGKPINQYRMIILGLLLQLFVVVFRIQNYLNKFIETVFHKDATLTDRTYLWDQALLLIPKNWLWGKGNANVAGFSGWLTKEYWNSNINDFDNIYLVAHNQLLEIVLNGGIFTLLPFLLAFISASRIRVNNARIKNCITGGIFAYLIVMLTEVLYPFVPVWMFLLAFSSKSMVNKISYRKENCT